MLFCPTCGNCLLMDRTHLGLQFSCKTCPYVFKVTTQVAKRLEIEQKRVDDIIGDDVTWRDAPQTSASCPKCQHFKAFFYEVQLRSADEPSTIFYKCVKCGSRWREN